MLERNLRIKQINSKDCFCYVSSKIFKNLAHKACAKIVCQDERVVFLSFGIPSEALTENELGLSGLYLKALGIKESEVVTLSEIAQLPEITSVKVSPLTENDYDILDLVANEVQSNLLSQLKVVANGQNFVAWFGNSITVMLHTEYIFPISPGILDDMTEVVVVKPNPSSLKSIQYTKKDKEVPEQHAKNNSSLKYKITDPQEGVLEKYLHQKNNLIVRLVPMSSFTELQEMFSDNMLLFSIFIFRKNIPLEWTLEDTSFNVIACALKKLKDDIYDTTVVYFRFCVIDDFIKDCDNLKSVLDDNAFVHPNAFKILKCNMGERVFLKPINHVNLPAVKEIRIKFEEFDNYVKETFMKTLADVCEKHSIILNSEYTFEFINEMPCRLEFVPSSAQMCVLYPEFLRECKFTPINAEHAHWDEEDEATTPTNNFIIDVSNLQELNSQCMAFYLGKFKCSVFMPNILITGKPGMGKSTFLEIVKKTLSDHPYYAYFETLSCKALKGKTLESLQKVFSGVFANLVDHQPAVLAIDDLHIICKCIEDGKEPATTHYNRVSEMLHNMFHFYVSNNRITIIATALSGFNLNENIYESRGTHLFNAVSEIKDLNKNDKGKVLESFLSEYDCSDVNFEQLSLKLDGFVMQDIADLSKKAVFFAHKDDPNEQIPEGKLKITHSHCVEALRNTVVLSLDNINLHSPGEKDFSDIGGLDDVKKLLIESLYWPTKYSRIFDNAPLRIQSGLLLYGPPGTGKTILAGAAAKQCGLRLISVKGPELLSKYIGASEQAIRDIFEKAQSAKPCILFFDEFESLAPRRGYDDTGVTDRVVNQLLTQLDGVETLSGVCVMAATSRPDLLDPALLRPGRLDRQVKCPLPDKNTRLDILKVISKSMQLASDVDLDSIASKCAGFSGADLQSVLYSAQLAAVGHLFDDDEGFEITGPTEVTQLHLENALKKTRPSLPKNELAKFDRIYQLFEGGSVPKVEVGTKATFAQS